MNKDEKATNYETLKHIHLVNKNINKVVSELMKRGEEHDASKMIEPELESFVQETDSLSALTFGSTEYTTNLAKIKPALDHHYANNRHHPQHWKAGINDMNLIDVLEMFCDWAASCKRHADGNLRKSIEHNGQRFEMSPQLIRIFENSVDLFE